jgi:hypothetical protein
MTSTRAQFLRSARLPGSMAWIVEERNGLRGSREPGKPKARQSIRSALAARRRSREFPRRDFFADVNQFTDGRRRRR